MHLAVDRFGKHNFIGNGEVRWEVSESARVHARALLCQPWRTQRTLLTRFLIRIPLDLLTTLLT